MKVADILKQKGQEVISVRPTEPMRRDPRMFAVTTGLVSVSPYPSYTVTPTAEMNSATSVEIAAPPEKAYFRRPPKAARTFENTRRSKRSFWRSTHRLRAPRLAICSRLPF